MSFQDPGQPLLHNVRSDVEILEPGVSLPAGYLEGVLLDQVRLLLLLGLTGLVVLLDVLDQLEGRVQVGARGRVLTGLLDVGCPTKKKNIVCVLTSNAQMHYISGSKSRKL